MTLYFSLLHYNLLDPRQRSFAGIQNYIYFLIGSEFRRRARQHADPRRLGARRSRVVGGILVALLMDQPVFGQGMLRLMVIAPFFVMPTVSALVWKNLLMNPESGFFAWIAQCARPAGAGRWFDQLADALGHHDRRLGMAALRQPDPADRAAVARRGAEGGGRSSTAPASSPFLLYRAAAHRARDHRRHPDRDDLPAQRLRRNPRHHRRRPGLATTNIAFLVYKQALLHFDVGGASAGGIVAVVLANIVAVFLMRMIGKNLEA